MYLTGAEAVNGLPARHVFCVCDELQFVPNPSMKSDMTTRKVVSEKGREAVRVAGCMRVAVSVMEGSHYFSNVVTVLLQGGENYGEQDLMVAPWPPQGDREAAQQQKHVFVCNNFLDFSGPLPPILSLSACLLLSELERIKILLFLMIIFN